MRSYMCLQALSDHIGYRRGGIEQSPSYMDHEYSVCISCTRIVYVQLAGLYVDSDKVSSVSCLVNRLNLCRELETRKPDMHDRKHTWDY